ncbi:DUF6351 family protein [Gilvimarinus sp. F26214L]|uniref:DUF6351 family protein n=1 Tax=Gilvimarinus sp. DZF01 TaxID=3461371 RepID=UPI0040461C86
MGLLAKLSIGFLVLFLGAGGVGFAYLAESVHVMKEPPLAPVLALPDNFDPREPVAPYSGPHPRVAGRPAETFRFPIKLGEVGPVAPLFAGPLDYPFLCGENQVTDAQPLVDNQSGMGVPVYGLKDGEIDPENVVGYSMNCSHPTTASYYYNREGTREFFPLEEADGDIATIEVDGREVPFVVRLESGTINRYHYLMVALRGSEETVDAPNPDHWNKKLIYQFRGGVGIGKRQGRIKPNDVLKRGFDQLEQGYAMLYSTGTQTSNHYNMWLAEDTAARLKRQFVSLYGDPLYTVGIGGSGGAIQQYLIAQNHPGLLDAAIPLYSYPDMVTQTISTMDCEPLEYYFDVTDAKNPLWRVWENRSWIQGLSANSEADNRFTEVQAVVDLLRGKIPELGKGATECIQGWRGLTPLVHNPTFVHFKSSFSPEVQEQVHFSHWDDLKYVYGVDAQGFANSTWDNVGVQYGLRALREGQISPNDFLRLNRFLGGWKKPHEMKPEKLWLLAGNIFPVDLSFWSHHNMYHSDGRSPARRTEGSIAAIEAAYRSGHVFVGHADIPILDVRHYLEKDLDMHHSTASFAARQRLIEAQGHADNQAIWMAHKKHNPIVHAVEVMDQWMTNIRKNPNRTIAENRPPAAADKCLDARGNVIAQGDTVWDGEWNGQPAGACMTAYPRYKTSREVAGGDVTGDVFKCHLQPVSRAISRGEYGNVDMRPYQRELEAIFPDGVCDYSRGDVARPADLLAKPERYTDEALGPAVIARMDPRPEGTDEKASREVHLAP